MRICNMYVDILGGGNFEQILAYEFPHQTPQIRVFVALRKYQEPSRHDTRIDVMKHFFDITSCDVIVCLICLPN